MSRVARGRACWASALVLLASVLHAEGPPAEQPPDVETVATPDGDGRRTLRRFPVNVLAGAVGVFDGDNLVPFLVGASVTGAGANLDQTIADRIADPGHGFGKSFEDGAEPALVGIAVAGVFTAGRLSKGTRFRAMSYDLLDGFLVNWAFTTTLKAVVSRERPNGEDDKSFPSGHASNAFALATVVERHYGWKAGVPGYALAGLVAASRLQRNKHYLSDVLAGATLGYIAGRTVVRVNGRPLGTRAVGLSMRPMLGRRTVGLVIGGSF